MAKKKLWKNVLVKLFLSTQVSPSFLHSHANTEQKKKIRKFRSIIINSRYPITLDPLEEPSEENAWLPMDTLLLAILAGLLATLVTFVVALVIYKTKLRSHERAMEKNGGTNRSKEVSRRRSREDEEFG